MKDRGLVGQSKTIANSLAIRDQIKSLAPGSVILDNRGWTEGLNALDLLIKIGQHFRVNQMINEEPARTRLANGNGLSFTEFGYKLLQANDFQYLFNSFDSKIQLGGVDQKGNILAGIDLIKRTENKEAFGIFCSLLTDSKGNKIGKTSSEEKVWLDPELTSPFEFFQFWIRQVDADIEKMIRMFTTTEIGSEPKGKEGREFLAYYMTEMVHGRDTAKECKAKTQAIFAKGNISEAEVKVIPAGDRKIPELFFLAGMVRSRNQARRLISQKGIRINGIRVKEDSITSLSPGEEIVLQIGKKNFRKVRAK